VKYLLCDGSWVAVPLRGKETFESPSDLFENPLSIEVASHVFVCGVPSVAVTFDSESAPVGRFEDDVDGVSECFDLGEDSKRGIGVVQGAHHVAFKVALTLREFFAEVVGGGWLNFEECASGVVFSQVVQSERVKDVQLIFCSRYRHVELLHIQAVFAGVLEWLASQGVAWFAVIDEGQEDDVTLSALEC